MDETDLVKYRKTLSKLIVIALVDVNEVDLLEVAMLAFINAGNHLKRIRSPYLGLVDIIAHDLVTLQSFTPQDINRLTGFSHSQITELMLETKTPDFFLLGRGGNFFTF
jgi:hypothetical protein